MTKPLNNNNKSGCESHLDLPDHWNEMLIKFKNQYKNNIEYRDVLDPVSKRRKGLIVIIDHDIGGGANLYSSSLVESLRENGHATLRIAYNFFAKKYDITYKGPFYVREFTLDNSPDEWIKNLLQTLEPDHIFANELVTWEDQFYLTKFIMDLNIPYTVFVHDFFYICPSWNLISNEGSFCHIPEDIERCKECCADNTYCDYSLYYGDAQPDMDSWRRDMYAFLHSSARIICFSETARNYIMKAYTGLSNIIVAEHTIPDREVFTWKQRAFNGKESLTVAVVGNIGFHKGDDIVRNLIEHPEYRDLPVNIVIAGNARSFPVASESEDKKVIVTGAYDRKDLPELLDNYHVSAVLIPSICPETFSYTTSEALLLGYPVICIDIGASAERVRTYNAGIIVKDASAEGILTAFREILEQPDLIKEYSVNSRKYVSPSPEEHLRTVLSTLKYKTLLSETS